MPAYPGGSGEGALADFAEKRCCPFRAQFFGGGIYNPGRCPGLSDVALSGRWIARLANSS